MAGSESPAESLEGLEAQLGYEFHDQDLLAQALTHRSHRHPPPAEASKKAAEGRAGHQAPPAEASKKATEGQAGRQADSRAGAGEDNERLEFLGDAIVGFVVSDVLCTLFPTLSEGKLSRIKANLVSARSLHHVAERLELGRYLRLGPGEEKTGGRQKQALLSNAVEALVAALYRDGGLEPARQFVEQFLLRELGGSSVEPLARSDYKSALQEHLQGKRLPAARYQTVETRGPEHRKMFTVELWVGERCLARGEGASKKAAEQQAARQALEQLPGLGGTQPG